MGRAKGPFEHAFPEGEESKNYKLEGNEKGTILAIDIGETKHCEIEWTKAGKQVCLRKYYGKLEDPDIPKRPKSGYMIFGGEMREKAQKEVMDAGGGMGDIGKKISEWWDAYPETEKAELAARSARMKEEYD